MKPFGENLKEFMMNKREKEYREFNDKLIAGLEKAYEKLVEYKRYKKSPLIISKNGEVVEIPHEEIPPTTKYRRRSLE